MRAQVKAFVDSAIEHDYYMLQHVNGFKNKYVYLRPNEVKRLFTAALVRQGIAENSTHQTPPHVDVEHGQAGGLKLGEETHRP